jgi:hypothetical protein
LAAVGIVFFFSRCDDHYRLFVIRHLFTSLSIVLFTAHALSLSYHGHLSPENGGCPCGDGKRAAVVDRRTEREQLAGVCRLVGRWSEVL